MDRRQWVERFRERLGEVIDHQGISRSAFAARIGLDRSTLSQLLSADTVRLPRAETIAAIAREAQVSADWLLGLSQEPRPEAELVASAPAVERGGASPLDARLSRWRREAIGAKIRYVPTTLPDLLKTDATLTYEYQGSEDPLSQSRRTEAAENLAYMRQPETDMEACCSFQLLRSFAFGHGVWAGLSRDRRIAQLDQIERLVDELYPTFRLFLFDGLQRYCVPLTVFGPKRAAVYFGDMYFVFTATEHIRIMTRHFDELIRAAAVQPTEVGTLTRDLRRQVAAG
jgi:transcriptional regulator with XRE-family HTH domain